MFDKAKSGWILIAFLLMLLGVIFSIMRPDALIQIINIDLKNYTFSGSAPPLLIVMGAVFAWLGFRETKSDLLQKAVDELKISAKDAVKNLNVAAENLHIATDNIEGRIITLRFCLSGPNAMISEFMRLVKNGALKGKYSIKRGNVEVKSDELDIYSDPVSKVPMAIVKGVPIDTLIEIELEDNGRQVWRASESASIRLINMEIEKRD